MPNPCSPPTPPLLKVWKQEERKGQRLLRNNSKGIETTAPTFKQKKIGSLAQGLKVEGIKWEEGEDGEGVRSSPSHFNPHPRHQPSSLLHLHIEWHEPSTRKGEEGGSGILLYSWVGQRNPTPNGKEGSTEKTCPSTESLQRRRRRNQ